jgi:hypothetical protein
MKQMIFLLAALLCPWALDAQQLTLSEIPQNWPLEVRQPLETQRAAIVAKWDESLRHREEFVREFAGTEEGTARAAEAKQRKAELTQEADSVVDEADRFNASVTVIAQQRSTSAPQAMTPDVKDIVDGFERMAKDLGWSEDKIARLHQSFLHLDLDRDAARTEQVQAAWQAIDARGSDSVQAKEASAQGHGPGFPSMGRQTGFNDCAIFALSNAARLPYGFVAARAAKLISDSAWRSSADRANPQTVMEGVGLNGGELIMLSEVFGEAEVLKSEEFPRVLSAGRRVLVNVASEGGGAHEVVISRTFIHEGKPWFEMVNSHDAPNVRRYLSAEELDTIMLENGVAYRQERNRTAPVL